jgi:hypothetical protein
MNVNIIILTSAITSLLYVADLVSQYLYVHVGPGGAEIPHNARWFFIHALGNSAVALLGSQDLVHCIKYTGTCATEGWSELSFITFMVALLVHLYHIFFFWPNLSKDEWIHHGIMIGLSAPLSLYYPTRASIVALWFLTGCPGMMDYFLLWGVKMGWVKRDTEKLCNAWISVWIRSPGCMFSSFLTLPMILNGTWAEAIGPMSLAALSFWNGQYYMVKAIGSKKLKW